MCVARLACMEHIVVHPSPPLRSSSAGPPPLHLCCSSCLVVWRPQVNTLELNQEGYIDFSRKVNLFLNK